jgi:2-keto-4-pentenoate hydratase/2-oxohepta-3-ene-1,7-dioic acid hydratase in catechol pathway
MKIVVFVLAAGERRVGALAGERVVDLQRADPGIPARLDEFIAAGQAALDAAQRAVERAEPSYALGEVKLCAPWPGRRIACVGGNYADHLRRMEAGRGGELPGIEEVVRKTRAAEQWGFWKVPYAVAGPDDDVPYPSRTRYFDYEGEAAIVLGKQGKDIPADRVDEYVWGITLFNDWSIRDDPRATRPMSYNLAKNFDGSASMGPCIVVGERSPSPQDVDVEVRVNGQVRQQYNTRDMIFSFGEVLAWLSRDFTLVPGDVIAGGTSAGTAADQSPPGPDGTRPTDLFLKRGDVVEVSSPGIGLLRNRVV